RADLFRSVEQFSLREVNEFGAPSLITRTTNDVQQVQMLVLTSMTMMVAAPLTMIGGVIMALRTDVQLSALLLVIIPVMAIVIGVLVAKMVPLFRSMQVKIDRINSVLRENLAGIRVIRAFVRTAHEQERFAGANEDLTDVSLRVTRLFALTMPALMLIFNLSSVAIIWFGGGLVDSGDMQIGDLTAFLSYMMQILFSVMMAVMLMIMVPRAAASAERISAVLDTDPQVTDPVVAQLPHERRGVVEFRDVEFGYPGAEDPVLCGVNLTIEPGQTTAIVGSTGAGKTTLVNLIPRLYDVTGGQVLVDGVDVREFAQEDLWTYIGLVPQKSFLFSGTVGSNVRFGQPDADDAQVWEALTVAQAEPFVRAMPELLDAPIDQGGTNVSGGQRQRLSIARALVRPCPIYIFDDSFSALDYATDARLRAALSTKTRDAAVIIVAQRVSTIRSADQIVVLDGGRVVGVGTHTALMETCETYQEIVYSQLTAAEAAS
ncbi:MAG: ABC transporter ATP-binding protein/permease, partial [Candidatus Nanopelagicales bacterium]|nr:ABC transporter ATP-binding protein/permease [Candidatus Nanopelagicales bacterium]